MAANHSTIKDTGAFFTIVPETREVVVPKTHKIIGVAGDHLAEQLTFEVPENIDGHDIAGCARRYVSWKNVDGELGTDGLVELTEKPEGAQDGMLYFTWTIRDRLALTKGLVQFSVHFEDVAADGESILYHWGTSNCKNCEILESVRSVPGAYPAIWVEGDTLVIEDYAPVDDMALALQTPGIVPEGVLEITQNGIHDVAKYAQAEVCVVHGDFEEPTIKVYENGLVEATANGVRATHLLSSEDCADFVASNIKRGKYIFGVPGTLETASEKVSFSWTVSQGPANSTGIQPPAPHIIVQAEGSGNFYPVITERSTYSGTVFVPLGGLVIIGKGGTTILTDVTANASLEFVSGGLEYFVYKVVASGANFRATCKWNT